MKDFFITHEERLPSLRPFELACGLNVSSAKWKLSSRGLELLEKEMSLREEEWDKKGGAHLYNLLEFATCTSFVRNLAGITLAFAQQSQSQSQSQSEIDDVVPFAVWEASLFLWMNLTEPKILGETLYSLSGEALRRLLFQFGRLLLLGGAATATATARYLSQELVLTILLKMRAFYLQRAAARGSRSVSGSEARDRLLWVNRALPSHVRSELPCTPNAATTAAYGAERLQYRRWINVINAKNPLAPTSAPPPSQNASPNLEVHLRVVYSRAGAHSVEPRAVRILPTASRHRAAAMLQTRGQEQEQEQEKGRGWGRDEEKEHDVRRHLQRTNSTSTSTASANANANANVDQLQHTRRPKVRQQEAQPARSADKRDSSDLSADSQHANTEPRARESSKKQRASTSTSTSSSTSASLTTEPTALIAIGGRPAASAEAEPAPSDTARRRVGASTLGRFPLYEFSISSETGGPTSYTCI